MATRTTPGHTAQAKRTHDSKTGLTLIELLLVLSLLVVAGGIVMPAITGAFSSTRLRRAGDVVIRRWAEARVQAIETGAPYQFRFTADTGKYRVEPWAATAYDPASPEARSETGDSNSGSGESDPGDVEVALAEQPALEAALPAPIVFQGGQVASADPQTGKERVDPLQTRTAETWSTPILFFPDGTSSQATIVLENEQRQYVRITLRALTGVARATGILTRKELDRGERTR